MAMQTAGAILEEPWTEEYLIDRLTCRLAAIEAEVISNGETFKRRKYYHRAKETLHRIPMWTSIPPFVIDLSDLTPRLIQELSRCTEKSRHYVLTQTASRILENVDFDYVHLSALSRLKVKLEA